VYLNLVYNTGLPGGSPSYADVYEYQNRLRDYRRADAGFLVCFYRKKKIETRRSLATKNFQRFIDWI
jgi:hypothetical protein